LKLKDGYPKLTIFKYGYPKCRSDERSWIINEVLSNSYFKINGALKIFYVLKHTPFLRPLESFLAVSNISIYVTFYLFNYFVLTYVANGILNIIGLVADPVAALYQDQICVGVCPGDWQCNQNCIKSGYPKGGVCLRFLPSGPLICCCTNTRP
jgi:hypothetical protein